MLGKDDKVLLDRPMVQRRWKGKLSEKQGGRGTSKLATTVNYGEA